MFKKFMKWMKRDSYFERTGVNHRMRVKTWPGPPPVESVITPAPAKKNIDIGPGECLEGICTSGRNCHGNQHQHLHPSAHYIKIAIDAIERAKYSKNYHDDLLLDHLNIAGDALDTAMQTMNIPRSPWK